MNNNISFAYTRTYERVSCVQRQKKINKKQDDTVRMANMDDTFLK